MSGAQKRRHLIGCALLLTLVAAALAPDRQDAEPVAGAARERSGAASASQDRLAKSDEPSLKLPTRRFSQDDIELFSTPPAKPAAAQGPSEPTAPPLPFRFLGKMTLGKADAVMLSEKNTTVIASPGETLMGAWRMDSVDAENLKFTYLPLATTAVLKIGGAN